MDSTTVLCLIFSLAILRGCNGQRTDRGPPVLTGQPSKDVYYIHKDKPELLLPCAANGSQPLRYLWKRDGGASQEQFVTSGALMTNETGRYTCYAQNVFGTAVSRTVQVKRAELGLFEDGTTRAEFRVNATQPLVLPCGAPSGDPPPLVFWSGRGRYVLTNGTAELPWDSEQGLALDEQQSLVFLHATPGQAGMYHCEAMSPEIDTFKLFSLEKEVFVSGDVSEAPARPPSILPGRVYITALRGQDTTLYCLATGNPLPTVKWTRLGDPSFVRDGPVLQLRGVRSEQADSYTCEASSPDHPVAIQTRTLTVEAAPYWILPPRNLSLAVGGSDVFSCVAGGEPRPSIRWMENGQPKPEHDNQTTVTVTDFKMEDVKVLQCQATNKHGQIIANAILGAIDIGPKPTHVKSKILSRTSAKISWRPISHPSLIGFKVEFQRVRGTSHPRQKACGLQSHCRLDELRSDTEFTYTVVAIYEGGEVPSSEKTFHTGRPDGDGPQGPIKAPYLWQTVMIAFGVVLVIGVATPVIMCAVLCIRDQVNGVEMDELPTSSDAWGRGRPKPKVDKNKIGAPVQGDGGAPKRADKY